MKYAYEILKQKDYITEENVNVEINGCPPLYWAIANNDEELVAEILSKGAYIEHYYPGYGTLIMFASSSESEEIINLMLEYDAYPLERDGNKEYPFDHTIKKETRRILFNNVFIEIDGCRRFIFTVEEFLPYLKRDIAENGYITDRFLTILNDRPTSFLLELLEETPQYKDLISNIIKNKKYINVNYMKKLREKDIIN